jgi:spore coat polysaccharide biosynthesis protein SpsF
MDLAGAPMLARELDRVRAAETIDEIVVATTANATDDPVVELADTHGVRVFRGDEHDVLSRYLGAAKEAGADVVVRVTADCPLLDPGVLDRVVRALDSEADYASNVVERTFPQGLDCEALHRDVLERVGRLARSQPAREHVTWLIYAERPELFVRRDITDPEDNSDLSWTVDRPEDLERVRDLYERFGLAERSLPYTDLVAGVRARGVGA